MGPATPLQQALGVPWGHLRRRFFCSNLSRSGAANRAPFLGGNVYSAPREVVSLVVTPVVREVGFRCYAFLETLSTCLCNVVHEYSARATSGSNPK
jgi:hypothetical protein